MTQREFPQFDDADFASAREFLHALVAWVESANLHSPHAVVTFDPQTRFEGVVAPFATAIEAASYAERLNQEQNAIRDEGTKPVQYKILPLDPP